MENHVTSLGLSKRLKELGVKQESVFFWSKNTGMWRLENVYGCKFDRRKDYSAFLDSELGEMLPNNSQEFELKQWKMDDVYWITYHKFGRDMAMIGGEEVEVNARAKMLIYLIENKLLDPKTIQI